MLNSFPLNQNSLTGLRLAEVRSLDDYYKTGRVKIRFYGSQDDEQNVKDENLTEAMVILPITSASTAEVGVTPTGLVIGSRVVVGYAHGDKAQRTPIIVGSYYRGAKPKAGSKDAATGGKAETEKPGIDTPGVNPTMSSYNIGLKQKPFDSSKDKYNASQFNEREKTSNIKSARELHAPNADLPTTASGDASLDLPGILNQIDPLKLSMTLAQMYSALSLVKALMNSSSPAPRKKTITDALSGALCILSNEFGFDYVIEVMNTALENDGLNIIDEDYREIVKNSLGDLITKVIEFGPNNIPVNKYPIITYDYTTTITLPGLIVDNVPDLYIQQYYPIDNDPYPGYIQYVNDGVSVFVKRTLNEPTYVSPEEEIFAVCEIELANDLRPHFTNKDLTAELLNIYLLKQDTNVENNGMEKSMGKNAGTNVMGLLSSLLGVLGPVINNTLSLHLPFSVLNQGGIAMSMQKFSKNMAIMKKMKSDSLAGFNLPGGLSSMLGAISGVAGLAAGGLGGLAGLAGGLGGLGGLAGGLAGSLAGVSNLAGGLAQATNTLRAVNSLTSSIPGISPSGAVNMASVIIKIAS
jgi:hypothetical protein